MAYIFKNIDVLDLNPSTGVGISVPFNGPTGVNTTYTTQDAIKSNLLNFILTGKRERVMNPGFGAGLLGLAPSLEDPIGDSGVLFNQITEERIDQIENLIYGGVDLYFPTVKIEDLSVDQMLAGKQGITDLNQVSIDAVPDFSGLMGKMKEQGKI